MSSPRRAMRTAALSIGLLALVACGEEPAPARITTPPSPREAPTERATADGPRTLDVRWAGDPDSDAPLVVLMHGYGAPGDDLVPLGEQLARDVGVRAVMPEAPLPRPPSGRMWWHVDLARDRAVDRSDQSPPGLDAARRDVIALLERLRAEGRLDPARTVLAGFSQGAMMALDVALAWRQPIAGVVMLSGGPIDIATWTASLERYQPARVFVSHGRQDPLLAYAAAEGLAEQLREAGSDVTFVPFDGGHAIPPPVQGALVEWLRSGVTP